MNLRAFLVFAALASVAGPACKKDETKPALESASENPSATTGGGSGATGDSTGGSTTDAGAVCSNETPTTVQIAQTNLNDTMPTGTGGTIANGIYDLTADDVYVGSTGAGGATGIQTASTLVIEDGTFAILETAVSASNVKTTTNRSGTLASSGSALVLTFTCPLATSESYTYTVSTDGAKLTLLEAGTNEARTYTVR